MIPECVEVIDVDCHWPLLILIIVMGIGVSAIFVVGAISLWKGRKELAQEMLEKK